jgi:hypothetical protein
MNAVDQAFGFAEAGNHRAAIDLLQALNRRTPNAEWERYLVQWRYRGGRHAPRAADLARPAGAYETLPLADPFPEIAGVPEIGAGRLDVHVLGGSIIHHGALLVRGLLAPAEAAELADGLRCAFEARQRWLASGQKEFESPWYERLELPPDCNAESYRRWVESAGGLWAADSPRGLSELIERLSACRVVAAIAGYFGEQPLLSVDKLTLRCVPHTIRIADWHQDGAFLGTGIRSVNVWLSLSDCGQDASGLDFLPRRLDRILPTGIDGANFCWSVGPGTVAAAAQGVAIASPAFQPGDALLFDHFFLHRTGIPERITRDRYAVESWFFAPSAYPEAQVPLLV